MRRLLCTLLGHDRYDEVALWRRWVRAQVILGRAIIGVPAWIRGKREPVHVCLRCGEKLPIRAVYDWCKAA